MQDPRASREPQAHGCVVRMQAAMSAVSGGWTAGEGGAGRNTRYKGTCARGAATGQSGTFSRRTSILNSSLRSHRPQSRCL